MKLKQWSVIWLDANNLLLFQLEQLLYICLLYTSAGKSQYLLDNFVIDMIDAIAVRCVARLAARNAIRCVVHRYVCMACPCAPFLSLV